MTPDHQPITGQELEEMKQRCQKATEGPWQWWQEDDSEIILGNDDYAGEGHVLSCNRCQHCQKTMSDCALPRKDDQDFLAHARGDLPRCLAEIERLQRWVHDLQSGMYINCVYCGHRYGPQDKVPATMADALKTHVEQCPAHPMSKLRAENDRLRSAIQKIEARLSLDESKAICRDGGPIFASLLIARQALNPF